MTILINIFSVLMTWYAITKFQLSLKRVAVLILWPVPFFTLIMWISQEDSDLIDVGKVSLVVFAGLVSFALPSLVAFALSVEIIYIKNFIKSYFWFLLYAGFAGMIAFMLKMNTISIDPLYNVAMFVLHLIIAFLVYVLPARIRNKEKK